MFCGKQGDDGSAGVGDAATQPRAVVNRRQIGEKRVIDRHSVFCRGYRADAHRDDTAGRFES